MITLLLIIIQLLYVTLAVHSHKQVNYPVKIDNL
jgi:hypothetical protein